MAGLDDFFEDIIGVFAGISPFSEFIEGPVLNTIADEVGLLTFRLKLLNDFLLDFVATVDFSAGYPNYIAYSIHYQDKQGQCIFRYDNAPHHHQLAPFPQHKHVGADERAIDSALPPMRHIAREIQQTLRPPA